jgi:catechol 2,3-dioxygenase-like lactoylglutathione lyase family enzyme
MSCVRTGQAVAIVAATFAFAGTLLHGTASAQIASANDVGVAMGHLHFFVADVEASKAFWVGLGGEPAAQAEPESVRFPGVVILISERGSNQTAAVIDHVAFRVRSLEEVAARGFDLEMVEAYPGIASVHAPDGTRVELFEEGTATNIGFETAPGFADAVAERHNRALTAPIVTHHVHFYLPADQVELARDWYVEHFGATPGQRWRYDAADLPGFNLNFSASNETRAPTRGHTLDHIGFEVADLEAFCRGLEAAGIAFDQAYRRISDSLATAVLTDPWGTTIELTEGLRAER